MPTGHGKARSSANAPDNTGLNVNEKILKECHELYVDKTSPERGENFVFFLVIPYLFCIYIAISYSVYSVFFD